MKRAKSLPEVSLKKKQRYENTRSGELGIIESIYIRNFMCHENLVFNFDPHINFIIGQNGSGKSAVLTAIMLVLGGRSSITGRYSNAKGFIKDGKQKARIEVVLKNGGLYAYKPEEYGNQIHVVREITSDGGSCYKLLSAKGSIVATSKEELNNILTAMDIQIENPVSLLTQENSRSFLMCKYGKGEKLYQFFHQGAGLDALERGYNNARDMKEEAEAELKIKKEILLENKKELERLKKYLKSATELGEIKNKLHWAKVIESEKLLKKDEEAYEASERELCDKKKEFNKCKEMLTKKADSLVEGETKKTECDGIMTTLRDELTKLKADRENYAAAYRNLEGKLTFYKREETKMADEILSLENHIKETNLKSQNDINEDKKKKENELKEVERQISELKLETAALDTRNSSAIASRQECYSKIEGLKADIKSLMYNKQSQKARLSTAQSALNDRINIFGEKTQNILDEIKKSNSFSKPPIGPIGMYLEVKDPRWSNAVEACLTPNLLKSFCCDNIQDSRLLKDILRKYYNQKVPTVIVSQYVPKMYDVSQYKAQTHYPTVLDMLTIKNPVVGNCLIDQLSIESTILIEDTDTTVNVMLDNPPKNCNIAYTMNCDVIYAKPYRFYSSENKPHSLLNSRRQDQIKILEQEYKKADEECKQKTTGLEILQEQFKQYSNDIDQIGKQIMQCSVKEKKLMMKMEDLRYSEMPKDKYCLKEELHSQQLEYEKRRAEIGRLEIEIGELKEKREDIQNKMTSKVELLQNERKKYDSLCTMISSTEHDKETLASGLKKYEKEIRDRDKALKTSFEKLNGFQGECKILANKAEKICPRIEPEHNYETLQMLLTQTEKVLEEKSTCDKKELHQQYNAKLKDFRKVDDDLTQLEMEIQKLDSMYENRWQYFRTILSFMQGSIDLSFTVLLRQNDYRGKLIFNSEARTLELEAYPLKRGSRSRNQTKASTLSGGERSFVTVSFLLAMWDKVKTPFKILDEYDVFMDSNNRKLCIDLLIGQAKSMLNTQFIFLSPLDLPQIEKSPLVKIHKMPPPQRIAGR